MPWGGVGGGCRGGGGVINPKFRGHTASSKLINHCELYFSRLVLEMSIKYQLTFGECPL